MLRTGCIGRAQIVTLSVGLLLAILIWGAPAVFLKQHEAAAIAVAEAETVDLSVGLGRETAQVLVKVVGRLAADLESAAREGRTDLALAAARLTAAFSRAHQDLERTLLQAA